MAYADALRVPSNFSSGISAGGGDTGTQITPQPTWITKRVSDTTTSTTFQLPAGTVILRKLVLPVYGATPTAGEVTLVDTTGSVTIIDSADASAYQVADVAEIGPLTALSTITVTSSSISTGHQCDVGLVILPNRIDT